MRERVGGGDATMKEGKESLTDFLSTLEWRRFHVKQSIGNALNMLKAHSNSDPHLHTLADLGRQPPSPEQLSANTHSMPPTPMPMPTPPQMSTFLTPYSQRPFPPFSSPTYLTRPLSSQAVPSTRKLGSYSLLNLFRKAEYACYATTAATTSY